MTQQQLKRTENMMRGYAKGEPITIEEIKGMLYVFGSELACLRIFARYNANGATHNPNVRVGYSEPRQSHYLSLEMSYQ